MPNQTTQGDRKALRQANVLESLKDIGHSSVNSFKKDLLGGIPGDFMNQILGTGYGKKYCKTNNTSNNKVYFPNGNHRSS